MANIGLANPEDYLLDLQMSRECMHVFLVDLLSNEFSSPQMPGYYGNKLLDRGMKAMT